MTERIRRLRAWQFDKMHHAYRRETLVSPAPYRNKNLPDYMRTSLRLKAALEEESPIFAPGEIIAFTRTIRELPMIYDETEWAHIRDTHFIHERGTISNLSPDYGSVISRGLLSLREQLKDSFHGTEASSLHDAIGPYPEI